MAIMRLGSIIKKESGIISLPKNYKQNGKYQFLSYKNVYSKKNLIDSSYEELEKINIYQKDESKYYKCHYKKIICTWSSENNIDVFQTICVKTKRPFIINGFCKAISVDENVVDPIWLSYFLNSNIEVQKMRRSIVFTTRCNMKNEYIDELLIDIPPLDQQQKIIDIIEPFEKLMNNGLKVENQINNIIKRYLKIFNVNKNSKIGTFKTINGFAFKNNDGLEFENEYIFKISNISGNSSKQRANFRAIESLLNDGDVITGLSGTIGTSCIYTKNGDDIDYLNQRLLAIRSSIPALIEFIINKNSSYLKSIATGSVQKNITKNDVLNLEFDRNIINNFTILISNIKINIQRIKKKIEKIINNLVDLLII